MASMHKCLRNPRTVEDETVETGPRVLVLDCATGISMQKGMEPGARGRGRLGDYGWQAQRALSRLCHSSHFYQVLPTLLIF